MKTTWADTPITTENLGETLQAFSDLNLVVNSLTMNQGGSSGVILNGEYIPSGNYYGVTINTGSGNSSADISVTGNTTSNMSMK